MMPFNKLNSAERAFVLDGMETHIPVDNDGHVALMADILRIFAETAIPVDGDGVYDKDRALEVVYVQLETPAGHRLPDMDVRIGEIEYALRGVDALLWHSHYGENSRNGFVPSGTERLLEILTLIDSWHQES